MTVKTKEQLKQQWDSKVVPTKQDATDLIDSAQAPIDSNTAMKIEYDTTTGKATALPLELRGNIRTYTMQNGLTAIVNGTEDRITWFRPTTIIFFDADGYIIFIEDPADYMTILEGNGFDFNNTEDNFKLSLYYAYENHLFKSDETRFGDFLKTNSTYQALHTGDFTEANRITYVLWMGTLDQYNAITLKSERTLYLVQGYGLYKGSNLYIGGSSNSQYGFIADTVDKLINIPEGEEDPDLNEAYEVLIPLGTVDMGEALRWNTITLAEGDVWHIPSHITKVKGIRGKTRLEFTLNREVSGTMENVLPKYFIQHGDYCEFEDIIFEVRVNRWANQNTEISTFLFNAQSSGRFKNCELIVICDNFEFDTNIAAIGTDTYCNELYFENCKLRMITVANQNVRTDNNELIKIRSTTPTVDRKITFKSCEIFIGDNLQILSNFITIDDPKVKLSIEDCEFYYGSLSCNNYIYINVDILHFVRSNINSYRRLSGQVIVIDTTCNLLYLGTTNIVNVENCVFTFEVSVPTHQGCYIRRGVSTGTDMYTKISHISGRINGSSYAPGYAFNRLKNVTNCNMISVNGFVDTYSGSTNSSTYAAANTMEGGWNSNITYE